MPDGYTKLLEALSRIEFTDEHIRQVANNINRNTLNYGAQIEQEFLERANDIQNQDDINERLQQNKNIALDYYNAKQ